MNRFFFYFIVCNSVIIPTSLISTPLLIDQIANVYDTSSWSEKMQEANKKNLERGTMALYIIPPIGANFMLALFYSIFFRNEPTQNSKPGSDPYSEYTDEWREFLIKRDAIKKKMQMDSKELVKKYDSMPNLSSRHNLSKEMQS